MLILGVDPGLASCGWALLNSDTAAVVKAGCVSTSRTDEVGDTQRRLLELTDQLAGPMRRAVLVVVEWSSASASGFGRGTKACPVCHRTAPGNAQSALVNAAGAAAVIGMAQAQGIELLTPAPVTWRARLGYARDEASLHGALATNYPRTVARLRRGALPHVLDAIGLAIYGRTVATNLLHSNRTKGTR